MALRLCHGDACATFRICIPPLLLALSPPFPAVSHACINPHHPLTGLHLPGLRALLTRVHPSPAQHPRDAGRGKALKPLRPLHPLSAIPSKPFQTVQIMRPRRPLPSAQRWPRSGPGGEEEEEEKEEELIDKIEGEEDVDDESHLIVRGSLWRGLVADKTWNVQVFLTCHNQHVYLLFFQSIRCV